MNTRTLIIHALSPLHVGVGQGHDLIDLPIARERTTKHPIVPGSGLKGMLRQAAHRQDGDSAEEPPQSWRLFGPDTKNASDFASALRFSDSRILLFPISSDQGTFAWITSPLVLARFVRDSGLTDLPAVPKLNTKVLLPVQTKLADQGESKVFLGGMEFDLVRGDSKVQDWSTRLAKLVFPDNPHWAMLLSERLALVPDGTMSWAVEGHTEVRARIRISPETGTVAKGGLWYEESLPAESVLACQVQAAGNKHVDADGAWEGLKPLLTGPLSLGGNATVGQGRVKLHLHGGE